VCGIAGLWAAEGEAGGAAFAAAAREMAGLLARRGPDDEGYWSDPSGRAQLAFRRLAIIDTSPAGHQPMLSSDGKSVVIMNGEIYNYRELGRDLEARGVRFRSKSDTEVLVEGLNLFGLDLVPRLNGMFAFAWFRPADGQLALVRDHAGIKPLYYSTPRGGRAIAFGSQFDCLLHTPWGDPGPVRTDVLQLYLRIHHIPPPYGLLQNTHQLEPGHWLRARPGHPLETRAWWTLPRDAEPDLPPDGILEPLAEALDRSVRRQRIADVPLGVFLSGGVDSPLVTSVARRQTGPDLKAFTIGNPGWKQDESAAASEFGRRLDVDLRVHPISGEEALAAIDEVRAAQHEPFGDFSILPTFLVSRFAREEVTVSLSGDGGDELFFGYERPRSLLKDGELFRWPRLVRMGSWALGRAGVGPRRSDAVVHPDPGAYYLDVNARVAEEEAALLAPGAPSPPSDFELYRFGRFRGLRDLAGFSRYAEFYGQLQRGLKKVDMASMRCSLEVRVPLLDREVIDLSLRIDPFDCLRNGTRKAPLRDLLGRAVPPESIPKDKRGFAVPLADWLRGPLRPLAEETLLDGELYPAGFFDRAAVERYWRGHVSGEADRKWGLWTLMALQWWARGPGSAAGRSPAADRDSGAGRAAAR